MAAILFTQGDDNTGGAATFVVEFDVTTDENHNSRAEVTEHAVQKGPAVSDYVRPAQDTLTLTGLITNTPINDTTFMRFPGVRVVGEIRLQPSPHTFVGYTSKQVKQAQLKGGYTSPFLIPGFGLPSSPPLVDGGRFEQQIPVTFDVTSLAATSKIDRVKACYDVLRGIVNAGLDVTVVTDLREYESVIITDLSAPKNKPEDSISFTLSFKQVKFTNVTTTKARRAAAKRMAKPADAAPAASGVEALNDGSDKAKKAGRTILVDLTTDRDTRNAP